MCVVFAASRVEDADKGIHICRSVFIHYLCLYIIYIHVFVYVYIYIYICSYIYA